MTPSRRALPGALQKAARYAACGALPARHIASYSTTASCRCCGRQDKARLMAHAWVAGTGAPHDTHPVAVGASRAATIGGVGC